MIKKAIENIKMIANNSKPIVNRIGFCYNEVRMVAFRINPKVEDGRNYKFIRYPWKDRTLAVSMNA